MIQIIIIIIIIILLLLLLLLLLSSRFIPSTFARGEVFTVDHSMICKLGGFVIQRHHELRDLEAELLSTVCSDVETEPVLLDISGEQLSRGSNKAQDARLDIHTRGILGATTIGIL